MPRTQATPLVASSSSLTAQLPYDVLVIVVSMLDRPTLKQVRLCCNWLAKEATPRLFETVSFQMRAVDMERVIAIANCCTTANAVKELQLEHVPRLPKYKFEEWKRNAKRCPARFKQRTTCLPPLTRQLFDDYVAQRREPSLWFALHQPRSSFAESTPDSSTPSGPPTWPQQVRRLQKACFDLEKAVLSLRNLQQLRLDYSAYDAFTGVYWRGYCFQNLGLQYLEGNDYPTECAAQIAFLLRILGNRNASSNSLTSLRAHLACNQWWELQDLPRAWTSPEDTEYETYRNRPDAITKENMSMMRESFAHLTDIRIGFGQQENYLELPAALAGYLSRAKKLDRLELSARDFDLGDPDDMLLSINLIGAPWPMLRHLKLEGYHFTRKSILRTLSLVAPTLESLSLKTCVLFDEDSSWSSFYEGMRLISFGALHHLDFSRGHQDDFHPELLRNPCPPPPRKADGPLPVVHVMEDQFKRLIGYSAEIYDYILKRTDTKPPLQLFCTFSSDGLPPSDWLGFF